MHREWGSAYILECAVSVGIPKAKRPAGFRCVQPSNLLYRHAVVQRE